MGLWWLWHHLHGDDGIAITLYRRSLPTRASFVNDRPSEPKAQRPPSPLESSAVPNAPWQPPTAVLVLGTLEGFAEILPMPLAQASRRGGRGSWLPLWGEALKIRQSGFAVPSTHLTVHIEPVSGFLVASFPSMRCVPLSTLLVR